VIAIAKWQARQEQELAQAGRFTDMDDAELSDVIARMKITSTNFDTVVSLDFPHYCVGATEGCGGRNGWCYTFQGRLALVAHHRKVALIDVASRRLPEKLAAKVVREVFDLVSSGSLPYPNLRFSGSGEVARHHVPFLEVVVREKVRVWGFSRNLSVARELRRIGASVLVSCDRTSSMKFVASAIASDFQLAYTSVHADDHAPPNTLVVFPLHRSGRVREVVDAAELCPKVVEEFFNGTRSAASCQVRCQRCHGSMDDAKINVC
jgi:hypothetical protein